MGQVRFYPYKKKKWGGGGGGVLAMLKGVTKSSEEVLTWELEVFGHTAGLYKTFRPFKRGT